MIRKSLMLIYALGAYALSMAALVYIMGFLIDFGVPKGISGQSARDSSSVALWPAILGNAGLIALFGLHHSITARTSFKRWWTGIIPAPIERATYLYMTVAMTTLLVLFWQPIPITIWHVEPGLAAGFIYAGYAGIWTMMVAATFHFGHFGFLGLAQAWQNFRDTKPAPANMTARCLYALVRHPISLGWMAAPFMAPHFTVGHLVFAGATFAYILLATPFEEADLIEEIGEPYRDYRDRVPTFIPFAKRRLSKAVPEHRSRPPGR